jgi:CBS domain-containing protein
MHTAIAATRKPVCIDREASIEAASRLMREQAVDELVVIERQGTARMPLGFLSGRDVVTRVVALGLDPAVVTAGDVLGVKGVVSLDDLLQALAGSDFSRANRFHR